jgi:hypothetical protein
MLDPAKSFLGSVTLALAFPEEDFLYQFLAGKVKLIKLVTTGH